MTLAPDYAQFLALAEDIYYHPELGYKEQRTSGIVAQFLAEHDPHSADKITKFAHTGIRYDLSNDPSKPRKLAFIAELDAVYSPSHMHADPNTGAAHNCGHYSQTVIALRLIKSLLASQVYRNWDYNLSFVFVPAEEYLDLDYRQSLKDQGLIEHFGGKPEAMRLGIFDDFDAGVCIHSMGGVYPQPSIEINCDLAGFLYKNYTFTGKPAHAGFAPHAGVNAYSMSTLFNVGLGLLRQQLDDSKMVRMNPVLQEGAMTVNVIPDSVRIGTDIRAHDTNYMVELAQRLDNLAQGTALALGGQVTPHTQMGYLPFTQDRYLNSLVKEAFENFPAITYCKDNCPVSAAGDIGDLAFMFPCIQIGYSGFTGTIHGSDFIHAEPEYIFDTFPKFLLQCLDHFSGKLTEQHLYKRTYAQYRAVLDQLNGSHS